VLASTNELVETEAFLSKKYSVGFEIGDATTTADQLTTSELATPPFVALAAAPSFIGGNSPFILHARARGQFSGSWSHFFVRLIEAEVRSYGSVLFNVAANVSCLIVSAGSVRPPVGQTEIAFSAIGQY